MKRLTYAFAFLACLSVLSSCSRGYGCPYTSTELKPLHHDQQSVETSIVQLEDASAVLGQEELIAD